MMQRVCEAELQKRADNAGQLVLFFWLVLNFGKGTQKNRAIMSILGYFCLFWTFNLVLMFVGKVGWCQFSRLLQLYCGEGPCSGMA